MIVLFVGVTYSLEIVLTVLISFQIAKVINFPRNAANGSPPEAESCDLGVHQWAPSHLLLYPRRLLPFISWACIEVAYLSVFCARRHLLSRPLAHLNHFTRVAFCAASRSLSHPCITFLCKCITFATSLVPPIPSRDGVFRRSDSRAAPTQVAADERDCSDAVFLPFLLEHLSPGLMDYYHSINHHPSRLPLHSAY